MFPLQARFDAGELITQREKVSRSVSEALTERSAQFGLILDDISIVIILAFASSFLLCLFPHGISVLTSSLLRFMN